MRHSAEKHRQRWMANFELIVNELAPECCGKIDWNTATYFYNKGLVYDEAAGKYVASLKREQKD